MKKGRLVYEWENGESEKSLEEIFVEQIGGMGQ